MPQEIPCSSSCSKLIAVLQVSWAISANHGGGYQYRLCALDDMDGLTEKCFQRTPLKPVGLQVIFRLLLFSCARPACAAVCGLPLRLLF